jgi:hypothetical protein
MATLLFTTGLNSQRFSQTLVLNNMNTTNFNKLRVFVVQHANSSIATVKLTAKQGNTHLSDLAVLNVPAVGNTAPTVMTQVIDNVLCNAVEVSVLITPGTSNVSNTEIHVFAL